MAALTLGDHQQVRLRINGVDKAGNTVTTQIDAPATWSSSDATVATVAADPADTTGTVGLVKATGKLGSVTVTAAATAGGGTISRSLTQDITVGTEAESDLVLVADTPEEQA